MGNACPKQNRIQNRFISYQHRKTLRIFTRPPRFNRNSCVESAFKVPSQILLNKYLHLNITLCFYIQKKTTILITNSPSYLNQKHLLIEVESTKKYFFFKFLARPRLFLFRKLQNSIFKLETSRWRLILEFAYYMR